MPLHPDHCENATKTQIDEHKKGKDYYKQMQEELEKGRK
jgi:hypothetical protein